MSGFDSSDFGKAGRDMPSYPSAASSSKPNIDPTPTGLLREMARGNRHALDELLPLVYEELREVAQHHLRREREGHTLPATALVHEVYLKLIQVESVDFNDRTHFFSFASRLMRRVLVDHAKSRNRIKRGGGAVHVSLTDANYANPAELHWDDVLALDEALAALEQLEPRACRVVECRVFAGLGIGETAKALEVSTATVKRDWAMARAWLNQQLSR